MEASEDSLTIRDRFRIDVFGREFPKATDFCDGNWLIVKLWAKDAVSEVAIQGTYLETTDLQSLLDGVRALTVGTSSEFVVPTIEPMLSLSLKKHDDLGHFDVKIELRSEFNRVDGSYSVHEYEFEIDQTDLQLLDHQLCCVLDKYPVVGSP